MVTAFASTETAIEALRMGAYDYIHKPFNVEELKIVVLGALERRRLRRENVAAQARAAASATSSRTSSAAASRCWRSSS